MADPVEKYEIPSRYFCHRCYIFMYDCIVEDYTCPFCNTGFLEKIIEDNILDQDDEKGNNSTNNVSESTK